MLSNISTQVIQVIPLVIFISGLCRHGCVNERPYLLNGNIKNLNSEIRTYKNLDPLH